MKLIAGATQSKLRGIQGSSKLDAVIEEDRKRKEEMARAESFQERLRIAQENAKLAAEEASRASSPLGIAKETAKGVGSMLLDAGKAIVRMPVTVPTKTILTLNEAISGQPQSLTPQTKIEKILYGDAPVQSYSGDARSIQSWAETKGLSRGQAIALGATGAVGEVALDLATPGIGRVLKNTFIGRALTKFSSATKKEVDALTVKESIDAVEEATKKTLDQDEKAAVVEAAMNGASKDDMVRALDEESARIESGKPRKLTDQERGEAIDKWMAFNKKFTPDEVNDFKEKPVGVDELDFEKDGTITLYRDGKVEKGVPQSYSLVKKDNQVPVKVHRDEVIVNFNSKEITDLMGKSSADQTQLEANLGALRMFQELETEVIAIKGLRKQSPKSAQSVKKTSGYAKSLEVKAVEKEMADKFSELAEYTPAVRKEQAKMVSDLINKDMDRVVRILDGAEELPAGLRGSSLALGVEKAALKNNDVKLIQKLAKSRIATDISEAGSELSMLSGRNADSPVRIIRQVERLRSDATKKRLRGKSIAQARKTVRDKLKERVAKSGPSKQTWSSFIKEIQC